MGLRTNHGKCKFRTQVTTFDAKLLSEPREKQAMLWKVVFNKNLGGINMKINKDMLLSGGMVLLGVAQMVLSNKKQSSDINALEEKVAEKVMKSLSEKKD